jgi:hypothetical protein
MLFMLLFTPRIHQDVINGLSIDRLKTMFIMSIKVVIAFLNPKDYTKNL